MRCGPRQRGCCKPISGRRTPTTSLDLSGRIRENDHLASDDASWHDDSRSANMTFRAEPRYSYLDMRSQCILVLPNPSRREWLRCQDTSTKRCQDICTVENETTNRALENDVQLKQLCTRRDERQPRWPSLREAFYLF